MVICYSAGVLGFANKLTEHNFDEQNTFCCFVFFSFNYSSGHTWGWCSGQYLRAVNLADNQVGVLLDAIDNVNASEEVMVVLR